MSPPDPDVTRAPTSADALSELARVWRRYEGDPDGAIRAITETGCTAIDVARCSVWLLSEDRRSLRCADLYERALGRHTNGIVLEATTFPAYFAALESEEPIAAFDAHTDPRTAEFSPGYLTPLEIGALLDAPLRTGGALVGVVCNEHIGGRRDWTTSEQRDAAFLASLASLALELAQRARREALLAATLESTGEGIVAVDGAKVVAFNRRFLEMWELDTPPRDVAAMKAHLAARTEQLAGLLADATDILAEAADDTVDVIQLRDGRIYERTGRPQRLRGDIVGRVWSFRDVTLQRRAEAALRASEAHLRDLAIRDGLTGIYNRRFALEQLTAALTAAASIGEPVAVALLDVDFFKQVNDQHGHLIGDAVLRDFAAVLSERLRGSDLVGRYGGEEFVVVMRRATAAQAAGVLDALRARLSDRPGTEAVPRYTFSGGVAQFPDDGGDAMTLLACADERLYAAKHAGRNRLMTALPPEPSPG
ncbi:MAG: diguanylate cyclase [Myxococcales bacterium]|nr:diguanylate cyclase [Myxococcales bacterium]